MDQTRAKLQLIARLDYDSDDALRAGIERMRFARYGLPQSRGARFALRRYRTRRGWHVELYSTLVLSELETVALQAILGSDYRREAFNLFRASRLSRAPRFWRTLSHWNILHARKL